MRLVLRFVMQNDGDFVDVILLYNHKLQHRRTEVSTWSHDTQLPYSHACAKKEYDIDKVSLYLL